MHVIMHVESVGAARNASEPTTTTMATRRRAVKKGVTFCMMVVGASGTGEFTLILRQNHVCEHAVRVWRDRA